jgi:aquaporin Z
MVMAADNHSVLWRLCVSEMTGTALLIAVGLSVVIADFGPDVILRLLPPAGLRRLVTGFLFGATGAIIAVSPVGKTSGAHINPIVTLAFLLEGKMPATRALAYVVAQLVGAILGSIPLLAWGNTGRPVSFGATLPGTGYTAWNAVLGEVVTSFAMVLGLLVFVGHRRLRRFTPLLFPFLYALMVYVEAPISGTSTNPARSLGPSVISGEWTDWWVYWVGPAAGAAVAVGVRRLRWLRRLEVEVAKVYHFEHDPHGVFHAKPTASA